MKALITAVIAGLLAVTPVAEAQQQDRSFAGTIDGAKYRVEVPDNWNGTLLLYSHGYYLPEFAPWPPTTFLANREKDTPQWLLDNGYALAASEFKDRYGYTLEGALKDQIALLDWFNANVGKPRRTISTGSSQGGAIATLLSERYPHRFAGTLSMCGEYDTQGTWNTSLDINFAVKTLLAPGKEIDLVRPRNPAVSQQNLLAAVESARQDDAGRARLALAGALGNIPGWYVAHAAEPTELSARLAQQADWVQWAYTYGLGPGTGRLDLERKAGGNPSFNIGIDYRRLLAKSSRRDLVEQAYRQAGLDLEADLDTLARAPRIAPDPAALAFMYRNGIVRGSTPTPVVTLHGVKDGGALTDQVGWYAEQVRQDSKLRQLYIGRGGHCAFSAAEEIVALRTLLHKIDTGRWPDINPAVLTAAAGKFEDKFQFVLDLGNQQDKNMPPAFTRFTPAPFLRPSR